MPRRSRYLRIRCSLPQEPEVLRMSAALGLEPDIICGKLLRFWTWVTTVSENGRLTVAKRGLEMPGEHSAELHDMVDRAVDLKGFASALLKAGWLTEEGADFVIPEYDAWLSEAALDRAYKAEKATEYRASKRRGESSNGRGEKYTRSRARSRAFNSAAANAAACPTTETTPKNPPEQPIEAVETVGEQREWSLFPSKVAELQEAFPNLDALAECKRALAWLRQCPANRKTARGMARFLFNWLSRSTRQPGASTGTRSNTQGKTQDDLFKEQLRETRERQDRDYGPSDPDPVNAFM